MNNQEDAIVFSNLVRGLPSLTAMPLTDELAQATSILAAQQALRGADAIYASVAMRQHCILITLDNEHLTRLAGVVETRTPEQLLTELVPPTSEES